MEINSSEINDDTLGSDAEDQLHYTPAEVIKIMEEAWINEKFAPEILPHKAEVVDCLLGQINYMENNLEHLSSTDFKKSIYQMEVDRLRFLVSSYLRTRLEKIETYVSDILQQEQQRTQQGEDLYLSEQELEFAKKFSKGLGEYFNDLTKFYPGLPVEDWNNQTIKPNMHSFVFVKSKKEIEGIAIDDGTNDNDDLVDFNTGSQMILTYNSISNLIKNDHVNLI